MLSDFRSLYFAYCVVIYRLNCFVDKYYEYCGDLILFSILVFSWPMCGVYSFELMPENDCPKYFITILKIFRFTKSEYFC